MSGGLFEEDEQVLLRLAKRGEWTSFSAILAQIDKEHPVLRVTDKVSVRIIAFFHFICAEMFPKSDFLFWYIYRKKRSWLKTENLYKIRIINTYKWV